MLIPDWVKQIERPKSTEVRFINNQFYVYEIRSKWDPKKKRSKKITGKLIGKITSDGFKSNKNKQPTLSQLLKEINPSVKEYGMTYFINNHLSDLTSKIKFYFPDIWQSILACTYARFSYNSPMKNIYDYYNQSFLSENMEAQTDPKEIRDLFKLLGNRREQIINFFKSYNSPGQTILIDGTSILSSSGSLLLNEIGYSSGCNFKDQFNLMFIFSQTLQTPIYYKALPGNIREIKAFKLSLEESGLKDSIIVADKGFCSNLNIEEVKLSGLQYIFAKKRDLEQEIQRSILDMALVLYFIIKRRI